MPTWLKLPCILMRGFLYIRISSLLHLLFILFLLHHSNNKCEYSISASHKPHFLMFLFNLTYEPRLIVVCNWLRLIANNLCNFCTFYSKNMFIKPGFNNTVINNSHSHIFANNFYWVRSCLISTNQHVAGKGVRNTPKSRDLKYDWPFGKGILVSHWPQRMLSKTLKLDSNIILTSVNF